MAVARILPALQGGYRQDVSWAVADVARLRREAGRQAHESPTAWGLGHLEALGTLRLERVNAQREARAAGSVDPALLSSRGYTAREGQERREDNAVHLAVTLWALHQQSMRDERMHLPGWALGRSVRRLALGETGTGRQSGAKGAEGGGKSDADGADAARRASEAEPTDAKSGSARPSEAGALNETVRKRYVRVGTSTDIMVLATRLRELVLMLRGARIPLDYVRLADQVYRWQQPTARDSVTRAWGVELHRQYWGPEMEGSEETGGPGDGRTAGMGDESGDAWGADA
ncbi:type I-E CRISPR-associated protein Cse2/CasB (plasmid) [Streptomyces zhihengii]|uniref:Type I-E CRISPR-associated protein Cse2/CasB n=2 Tax=Streptomyces zhihengii TaxID=1818004 RepID=A0ABS2V7F5_9ACTN|nr:type I-E CRISPR-associated protein Cse2/CasB [Streptomyces zhihengii]MBM9624675.1 type I-E CRISPR-associated protein Cse2/CasB [Streptomyces zhihengii]